MVNKDLSNALLYPLSTFVNLVNPVNPVNLVNLVNLVSPINLFLREINTPHDLLDLSSMPLTVSNHVHQHLIGIECAEG